MKHKLLSILLSLSLVISLLPTVALADEGETENNSPIKLTCTVNGVDQVTYYDTISAAAKYAATITATSKIAQLLTDIVEDVPNDGIGEFCLVIDLNGHRFTGTITKNHDLTIMDSSNGANGTAHLKYVRCNVLTLKSGTVTIDDATIEHGTIVGGANVTINGGEYKNNSGHSKAIDKTSGTLTVNSGYFSTNDNLPENPISVSAPTGYVVGRTEQGSYTVQKKSSGGSTLYFCDLRTAALAAADGDTIELLGDQIISRKVEISASVTLDGKGYKIGLAAEVRTVNLGTSEDGVFVISGDSKNAVIRNAKFENIDYNAVLIRAYNSGSNSLLTVDGCTFNTVKGMNVIYAASSNAAKSKLNVTNSIFKSCTASGNGIIYIANGKGNDNANSEFTNNNFVENTTGPVNGAAVIYLSAPAKVENNYFENNTTKATAESSKNGIIVTGSKAKGSTMKENAFVSHTFTDGKGKGAVYGAQDTTTVTTNYYADGITHLVEAAEGFTEGTSTECYKKNATTGVTAYENHNYSTNWTSDTNDHWHTCQNCGSVTDKAAHVWNNGTVTTQPTTTTTGVKTYTCETCGATKTATIDKLPSDSSSSSDPTYAVSAPGKTENGTVTVSPRYAERGDTVTITVKPDSGYVLDDLTVTDKNGNELKLTDKGNGKYTFTMPAGKVEVKASFTKEIEISPFADVAIDDYYYEAVKWAVKNGVTDGVGNDLFAPSQPCTRAQIVTFLWRAAGSPEPKGTAAGMTDVVSGSYYEKAVAWAIENGITTGTTAATFSPDATCTRAQAVTFLARALNAKAASAAEFSDVPADSYFANAVAWASANGVTEGVGNGLFAPDNNCTRGQIVTFLFRAYNK